MDVMEICNNIEKRLFEVGLVAKQLEGRCCICNQARDIKFEVSGCRNDAEVEKIVKEEVTKDKSFDCEVWFGKDKNNSELYSTFGFTIKPKNLVEADRENLKKLLRLSKARKIIESMLPFMPKENIEGIYEIVQMAEDFLKEEAKYDEPTLMEEEYILVSLKHTGIEYLPVEFVMWKSGYAGYTSDLSKAGTYTLSEMKEHWKGLPSWLKVVSEELTWGDINSSKADTLAVPLDQLGKLGFVTRTVLMKE